MSNPWTELSCLVATVYMIIHTSPAADGDLTLLLLLPAVGHTADMWHHIAWILNISPSDHLLLKTVSLFIHKSVKLLFHMMNIHISHVHQILILFFFYIQRNCYDLFFSLFFYSP